MWRDRNEIFFVIARPISPFANRAIPTTLTLPKIAKVNMLSNIKGYDRVLLSIMLVTVVGLAATCIMQFIW